MGIIRWPTLSLLIGAKAWLVRSPYLVKIGQGLKA